MDRYVARFEGEADGDLRLCLAHGVAHQVDMRATVDYAGAYFDHYAGLEGTEVANCLNSGRCSMVSRFGQGRSRLIDFGAGSGAFVKAARSIGLSAYGFDVMPETVRVLQDMGAFESGVRGFEVVTFWDSLEHLVDPGALLAEIDMGAVVLVALPVFPDLLRVRESKHFKPGEHLYYWTPAGFVAWMELNGFDLLGTSDHETDAGRESIGAFAFQKTKAPRCVCGGEVYMGDFLWPRKPQIFFWRCSQCWATSEGSESEAEAMRQFITHPLEKVAA